MTLLSARIASPLFQHSNARRPHWVVGDPAGRRFSLYRSAAKACGLPMPMCVDWIDLIDHGSEALHSIPFGSRLRIDSFGDRQATLDALIRLGGGIQFPQRGEICSLHEQYVGMCLVLRTLHDWAGSRTDVVLDQAPRDIEIMFDKWATHRSMLPLRTATILLPETIAELNDVLLPFIDHCGGRVLVKPRYASSASGVCCYRVLKDRQQLIAPIEIVRQSGEVQLFNSLRVRSYTDPKDIQDIFGRLVPQGTIAEAAVNKARVDGDRFDLRVVVINGQADHVVVRQSGSPMTNLHLGNRRGTLESVVEAVGEDRLMACRDVALQAASRFPETLYCGVDVLLPHRGEPLVCEVNAFGDFLPNVLANGRSVYEAILQADVEGRQVFA